MVSCEVELSERVDNGLALGIDRNVDQIALSTGDIVRTPDVSRLEARRKRYQRMVSRRRKGSNRRSKARHLLAKTSRKIALARRDWCHQVSRRCANTASEVVVEDLSIRSMTRSAKGTREHPGRNVKAKSGLNRSIRGSSWGLLEQALAYKTALTKVPPHRTSQRCHRCGHVDKDNRRSQAGFKCLSCGHEGNADVNAALNILALGTGASGRRGALALATPLNRQELCMNRTSVK